MIVGNGATDFSVDVNPSQPRTLFNFQIIKRSLLNTFEENECFFSFGGVLPETHT